MGSKASEKAVPPSGGAQPPPNNGSSTGIETAEQLSVHNVSEKKNSYTQERETVGGDDIRYVSDDVESLHVGKGMTAAEKVDNMEEIALYALHVEDNRSLNPWTFRMWFLGS